VLLLLDNYDSFTYNLYDYLSRLHVDCRVVRNDQVSIADIEALQPTAIVVSPGPKRPADAGITMELIRHFHAKMPILGICLGHQALGEFFGATLVKSPYPMHGKTSMVQHNGDTLFNNIPNPFEVMRYHSLELDNLAATPLQTLATTHDGAIMAIKHPTLPLYGLQFHPESILTPQGFQLLQNWVGIALYSDTISLD
jgi:anthranilate synthase/aminodeoxychorismate synthase-like glutamine amidotransferase